MDITAAQGPRTQATITPPTICPVEPPGMGILNIIITNVNAALRARSGICFACKVF